MNERNLPYIVELALPHGGFGARRDEMETFHRLRGLSARVSRQRRDEQEYVQWCFARVINADDFAQQFGGTLICPEVDKRSMGRPC
jgi:hypothetical protein